MRVVIIDFEDSFTFNIYSMIKELEIEAYVVNYKNFNVDLLSEFSHIILGPGPGSILDYQGYFPLVDKLILDALGQRIKLIGICLGHQLIHNRLGREVSRLENPIHGQSIEFSFPDSKYLTKGLRNKNVSLQFYNSWGVVNGPCNLDFELEIFGTSDEILASFSKNITTYQFHCESIGTSFQKELFHQFLV
ncbi:aminodeoxychorismate/anthranilate synthase component II [Halobacteriovorax sp. JY17]|uniref:aminodeoxychorismate/anthranilate synthase component II n=1 Tax=Halobacteriovorax sp. JY17 TaxID=2014617 RepID=UPI000C60BF35|nr:aminodeoxychorismate/anthranilate synthase component II [Halobacteriovorax sp. JY17]PIK15834.1 MAG: hypothetical protein CES88_03660 [Halobacteriovorax sp. JY17]